MKEYEPLKKQLEFEFENMKPDTADKLIKNINVKQKGDMYLYNYNDKALVDRDHCVLIMCRGLVLHEKGVIMNYPFDRFFNDFEKECAKIDWTTAQIQEKVDGSLINVFWNGKQWEITTRGSFYPNPNANIDYAILFKQHFNRFNDLDRSMCYMFELVTQQNVIVTSYDEENVYIIGVRRLIDEVEMSQDYLDMLALQLQIKRPKTFPANNVEECKELFKEFKDDDEGLVVVDGNFNRMKLKQDSYIKLMRIKELRPQDLFEYILDINPVDEEYLKKCPEVIEEIDKMKEVWAKKLSIIRETFNKIKDSKTRKEFAKVAENYPYKGILFTMLDGKEIIKVREQNDKRYINLKWNELKEW